MKRNVSCFVNKAGFEPKTLGVMATTKSGSRASQEYINVVSRSESDSRRYLSDEVDRLLGDINKILYKDFINYFSLHLDWPLSSAQKAETMLTILYNSYICEAFWRHLHYPAEAHVSKLIYAIQIAQEDLSIYQKINIIIY